MERLVSTVGFCCASFISNSCNEMHDVHRASLNERVVRSAYNCGRHAFNNFREEVACVNYSNVVNQCLFLSKTAWNKSLFRKLFDTVCEQKYSRVYAMVLY